MSTLEKLGHSRKATANALDMSVASLDREVRRGRISFRRLGLRRIIFTDSDIERYLAARESLSK